MSTDTVLMSTDTTPFALPFIGGVALAVPCRVPQNYTVYLVNTRRGKSSPICVMTQRLSFVAQWRLELESSGVLQKLGGEIETPALPPSPLGLPLPPRPSTKPLSPLAPPSAPAPSPSPPSPPQRARGEIVLPPLPLHPPMQPPRRPKGGNICSHYPCLCDGDRRRLHRYRSLHEGVHGDDDDNDDDDDVPPPLEDLSDDCASGAEIDLAEFQLSGTIPSTLALLTQLEKIRLHDNLFSGTLPAEVAAMGEEMRVDFHVSHNRLSGTLPPIWGAMSRGFFVNGNQISGTPNEIKHPFIPHLTPFLVPHLTPISRPIVHPLSRPIPHPISHPHFSHISPHFHVSFSSGTLPDLRRTPKLGMAFLEHNKISGTLSGNSNSTVFSRSSHPIFLHLSPSFFLFLTSRGGDR